MIAASNRWIQRHPLLFFFTLTYGINYTITFANLYAFNLPNPLVWFLQVFSPSISAVITAGLIGGRAEIGRLLSGFTRWKVGWRWYLAALTLTLGPLMIALVYIALGNPTPGLQPGMTLLVLLGNLVFTFFSGPFAEEAGWRGFALPRLQEKYNALLSSIILGVIWACWHIPFYFQPTSSQRGIPFPFYVAMNVALAIFITWIYNNTKGSLVLSVLAHFCFNFDGAFIAGYLGLLPPLAFYVGSSILLGILLILIVILYGPKYLSRKPLEQLPLGRLQAKTS